jgi:glycerol-3-phosphate dehydrogenase (NAD(P)+)
MELAQGLALDTLLSDAHPLVEGVKTAKSAIDLARKLGVEIPICEKMYAILYEGKDPRQAVYELMTREPKSELA